jgi:DNA polymerase-3 subunit delta'
MPPSAESSTILFDSVRGHGRQKQQLLTVLESGRIPHALLFTGPSGVGKRQIALALAQGLFCSAASGRPCGGCSGCIKSAASNHPDLLIVDVDPETKSRQILLPQIQTLSEALSRTPGESGRHAVIIDHADRMSEDAQSAFLKTLEEPMGQTFFILITSDLSRLMPTILSRCQTLRFGALGQNDTEDILLKEDGLSPREATDYARLSQGSVEEAMLLRDGGYREIADAAFSLALLTLEKRPVAWPDLSSNRDELLLTADALVRIYRDVLLLGAARDTNRLFFTDRITELQRLAASIDPDRAQTILESICIARDRLLSYVSPRLVSAQLLLDLGLNLF